MSADFTVGIASHPRIQGQHYFERLRCGIYLTNPSQELFQTPMTIHIDNKPVTTQFLEMFLVLGYSAMKEHYLKTINGMIIVYSITDSYSFSQVKFYYEDFMKLRDLNEIPIIVVGDECEKENERQVSKEEGKQFAESINAQFIEVSSKAEINIGQSFMMLMDKLNPKKGKGKDKDCIIC